MTAKPVSNRPPEGNLSDWARSLKLVGGTEVTCFSRGQGPGVLLLPEVPGVTPEVLGLGDHLVAEGFTVLIPSLFGTPGRSASVPYVIKTIGRMCVSAEFRAFALGAQRPVTEMIRALVADLAADSGHPRVGVIGMCFTGGFALAAAVDPAVAAAVASQPAVPFPISSARRRDPGMSKGEFDQVAERAARGELCALGLRFSQDSTSPVDRFATIRARLGDSFEVLQLDSSPGNQGGFSTKAHSVLTGEVRLQDGHPAYEARARVTAFLRQRLS